MSYKHNSSRSRRTRSRLLGILIALLVLALVCGGLFLRARSQVSGEARVMPGVTVGGTDLSGMTRPQVLEELRRMGYGDMEGKSLTLSLEGEEYIFTAEELGLVPDLQAAADAVMACGRSGNADRDALSWLLSFIRREETTPELPGVSLREDILEDFCGEAAESLERESTRSIVFAGTEYLEITLGTPGTHVDRDALEKALKTALEDGSLRAEYTPEIIPAEAPDLEELWKQTDRAPENARFDDTYQVQPDRPGCTFDLDAAKQLLASAGPGDKVSIPLVYEEAEITAEELEAMLFRDLLASVETPLTSNAVRTHNIELAAARIHNTILLPGQEFSYNGALGERTEEKGYGSATAYRDGQVVEEVGGGICQLSSALYYCALLADETILERECHRYYQSYLPLGMDATVSWGGPDFSFKLKDEFPIRMYAWIEGDQLKVEFWGTRLEEGHVELEYEVNAVYPHDTLYVENKNVRSGTSVTLDYGRDGMVVTTYRVYYDGEGNLIEKVEEAVNEYSSRDAEIVVAVGEIPKR